MGSPFDGDDVSKSKLDTAKEAILMLLDHLKPDDKLGIVLFNDHGTILLLILASLMSVLTSLLYLLVVQVFEDVSALSGKATGNLLLFTPVS